MRSGGWTGIHVVLCTAALLTVLQGPLRASVFVFMHGLVGEIAKGPLHAPFVSLLVSSTTVRPWPTLGPPSTPAGATLGWVWALKLPWRAVVPLAAVAKVLGVLGYVSVSSWVLQDNLFNLVVTNGACECGDVRDVSAQTMAVAVAVTPHFLHFTLILSFPDARPRGSPLGVHGVPRGCRHRRGLRRRHVHPR